MQKARINNQIRASELRVLGYEGENLGLLPTSEALKIAYDQGLDLIEISPDAKPPVAKIMDFGKYQYELSKKQKKMKAKAHVTETKTLQVKIGTGEHDLGIKAKQASNWLKEGHRIRIDLFLAGRAKYMDDKFLKERLERILHLITEDYKIAEEYKKGMKGRTIVIEKDSKNKI
ncbi:MAG: translation initiation factor IF-3 [Candidatus Paceibacterota bacterium]